MAVGDEQRFQHGGRATRSARGELLDFRRDAALRGDRVVGRERRDPTLGGSDVAERI